MIGYKKLLFSFYLSEFPSLTVIKKHFNSIKRNSQLVLFLSINLTQEYNKKSHIGEGAYREG